MMEVLLETGSNAGAQEQSIVNGRLVLTMMTILQWHYLFIDGYRLKEWENSVIMIVLLKIKNQQVTIQHTRMMMCLNVSTVMLIICLRMQNLTALLMRLHLPQSHLENQVQVSPSK